MAKYCPVAPCLDIFPLKLNLNILKSDLDAVENQLHASMQVCKWLVICDLIFDFFSSETCYYLQKLVSFARCCTSCNFLLFGEIRTEILYPKYYREVKFESYFCLFIVE